MGADLGLDVGRAERASSGRLLDAKGHSFCLSGNCAYTRATRMATTRLLDQIVVEATSEPFRNALKMEPAPSVAQEPSSPPTPP